LLVRVEVEGVGRGLAGDLPNEAADDPQFMVALAEQGVEAIRINCAHDDRPTWQRMIDHAKSAEAATGHRLRVMMDLAGLRSGPARSRMQRELGMSFAAMSSPSSFPQIENARQAVDGAVAVAECTLPEAVHAGSPDTTCSTTTERSMRSSSAQSGREP